jgi:ribosomal-protein-alanine N-acetyltransferase
MTDYKIERERVTFSIRKMEVEDVEKILPMASSSFINPWSREMFLGELTHSFSYCFLLCEENAFGKGAPAGFICFRIIAKESELLNICLHPKHRQKGLGKELMKFYTDFCKQRGVERFYLEVDPLNLPAVHLYQSFEFQQVGVRKYFYRGRYEALVMEK